MTNTCISLVKGKNNSILIGFLFLPFLKIRMTQLILKKSISRKSSFRLKEATEGRSQNQQKLNKVLKHINTFQNYIYQQQQQCHPHYHHDPKQLLLTANKLLLKCGNKINLDHLMRKF